MTGIKHSSNIVGHQSLVAHFDLATAVLHQLQRKFHRQTQLSEGDQSHQVASDFVIGFVVVGKITIGVSLIEVGRVDDRLARCRRKLLGRGFQFDASSEAAENGPILARQFHEDVNQVVFRAFRQRRAEPLRGFGLFGNFPLAAFGHFHSPFLPMFPGSSTASNSVGSGPLQPHAD